MTNSLLILAQAAPAVAEHVEKVATLSGNVTFGLAGAGAAIGIGLIGARATEAVGRNPGSFGRALTMAIIFAALAEAMGIFGLVFMLLKY
jgi:F-type H+-transporting ATPase subunit c